LKSDIITLTERAGALLDAESTIPSPPDADSESLRCVAPPAPDFLSDLDQFNSMWNIQAQQQRDLGLNPDDLGEVEHGRVFGDLVKHIYEEAGELSRVVPVHKRHILRMPEARKSAVAEEIADILKLTIAAAQMQGLGAREVYDAFVEKTHVVFQKAEQERLELEHNTKLLCFDLDDVIISLDPWRAELGFQDERLLSAAERLHAQETLKSQFYEGGRFRKCQPIPGAAETLRKAKAAGYTIAIITARPQLQYKRIRSDTVFCLKEHDIPFDILIFNRNKVEALQESLSPAWPLFFVEDMLKNARDLHSAHVKVLLFTQPHNVGAALEPGMERIASWDEIARRIV
jgi:phosphoglycolate phosphatase-like HAD superfamily hydrolase